MKIGFIVHPDLRGMSLEEVVTWGKSHGFHAIDVWPGMENIQEICAKHDMEIGAVGGGGNIFTEDPDELAKAIDAYKIGIDRAAEIGAQVFMTLLRSMDRTKSTPENFDTFAGVFGPVIEHAEEHGVKIAVENCPFVGTNLAYSPEIWRRMFEVFPSDNFGLCFDPSHLVWLGIDYLRALREFGHRVFYAHAKDTEILCEGLYDYGVLDKVFDKKSEWDSGWWRYRLPGLGEVDWARFISLLAEIGYDGIISIEHEDPVYEGTAELTKKGLILGQRHISQWVI
jgi:sugar phosphate isomerase/epimerase